MYDYKKLTGLLEGYHDATRALEAETGGDQVDGRKAAFAANQVIAKRPQAQRAVIQAIEAEMDAQGIPAEDRRHIDIAGIALQLTDNTMLEAATAVSIATGGRQKLDAALDAMLAKQSDFQMPEVPSPTTSLGDKLREAGFTFTATSPEPEVSASKTLGDALLDFAALLLAGAIVHAVEKALVEAAYEQLPNLR
jgi:hypothetical protein